MLREVVFALETAFGPLLGALAAGLVAEEGCLAAVLGALVALEVIFADKPLLRLALGAVILLVFVGMFSRSRCQTSRFRATFRS